MTDSPCNNIVTSDCFAKRDGLCKVLNSTDFRYRKDICPFYKSIGRMEIEKDKCKERLRNLRG